jgi:hypothetical protein
VRILAVDWSGRQSGERPAIVAALVDEGRLVEVRSGRSRSEVVEAALESARDDDRLVVGLDFAFSFPAWFLEERGFHSALELWDAAAVQGEEWLARCDPPFYGRAGRWFPTLPVDRLFRRTELAVPAVAGIRPKPVFKIGLQGNVGTGAIRGMPYLARLHHAGFHIWPFDPPGWPRAIEIYPRLLTGPVDKARPAARSQYLNTVPWTIDASLKAAAQASEDAFDATVSALRMWDLRSDLEALPAVIDPVVRLEGWIWLPGVPPPGGDRSNTPARSRAGSGRRLEL